MGLRVGGRDIAGRDKEKETERKRVRERQSASDDERKRQIGNYLRMGKRNIVDK